jgi:heme-degrading monooxygenase HmoA
VTSASFNDPANPEELPRISRFAVKVSEAIAFLGAQPGNLRHGVFNGGFDGREGFTLTLWDSDDAMLKAAYHSGHHRKLMDESRDGSTFDRSSFTRLRILQSSGSWDGDPLAAA